LPFECNLQRYNTAELYGASSVFYLISAAALVGGCTLTPNP
jgi:hypothetical protein